MTAAAVPLAASVTHALNNVGRVARESTRSLRFRHMGAPSRDWLWRYVKCAHRNGKSHSFSASA